MISPSTSTTSMPSAVASSPCCSEIDLVSRSGSPVPGCAVLSSCSEADSEDTIATINSGSSIASPAAVCTQRSLSAAVVTSPDATHKLLDPDRPKIVVNRADWIRGGAFAGHRPHAPLRPDAWSEPGASDFKVRGATYLNDGRKVASPESLFALLTVDLVQTPKPVLTGMCAHPGERVRAHIEALPPDAFLWAVNLCVPAAGCGSTKKETGCSYYHCVFYFACSDKSLLTDLSTPVGRLCQKFFFGDSDSFRDETFKLIPRIVEGNFVVRKAVGSKPSILGSKLKQHYIRDERFFELIVDIGSDAVAQRIVKLALGYAKNLTVDMMFLLEGKDFATLPERILGGVRMHNVDFKKKDGQRILTTAV